MSAQSTNRAMSVQCRCFVNDFEIAGAWVKLVVWLFTSIGRYDRRAEGNKVRLWCWALQEIDRAAWLLLSM